ncbi:MAG: MarR family transcriptional regulator [Peptostreptococcaceae bacterium]|nr:MarR family transcriptional regulator [Peptostreptococcaceae bacterium]
MQNPNISLGKYISIIYRHGKMHINEKIKQYGLSEGQAVYLMALYHHDGIRQEDLCRSINIDKGTTAKALKKLESSGYVSKQIDSLDKRAYRIYLTDKALSLKDDIKSIYMGWTDILANEMSAQQRESAIELLKIMSEKAANNTFEIHRNKEQENTQ